MHKLTCGLLAAVMLIATIHRVCADDVLTLPTTQEVSALQLAVPAGKVPETPAIAIEQKDQDIQPKESTTVTNSDEQKKLPYTPKPVDSTSYEPYLTTLNLGSITISDAFAMYGSTIQKEKYYIPVQYFAKIMNIPLEQKGDLLVGWFLKESNKIEIDTKTGIAKVGSMEYKFTADDAMVLYTDMFISFEMMDKMFPMVIKFDLSQQVLNIETKTPFPIEQAIARQEALGKIGKDGGTSDEEMKNAKLEVQNYQAFSMPNIDASYMNIMNLEGLKSNQNLSFSSKSHLLYSTLNTSGSVGEQGLNSMKVSLQRNDSVHHPFEHYLRPKQYWVGDIAATPTNLISNSSYGIGASVSNIPAGWKIDFNNLQITGYAIPNWSVEIYLNNNLLNFATVDATGFYLFEDIPLNVGLNAIKLIFYGPFGQTREVTQKVNLSASLLQKGQVGYDFSVVKERLSLIQTPSSRSQSSDPTTGTERYNGNVRYGLGGETSLAFGMTSYMKDFDQSSLTPPERQNYLSSSLITSINGVVVNTDVAYHTNTEEGAAKLSLNTPIFKESNLFVSSQFFTSDFISEAVSQSGSSAQKNVTEVRLKNGTKFFTKFIAGTYSFKASTFNSGITNYIANAQHSVTLTRAFSAVNTVELREIEGVDSSTGSTSITYKSKHGMILRGTFNYTPLFSSDFFNSNALSVNYNWGVLGVTGSYNMNFVQGVNSYTIGLNINSKYLTTTLQFASNSTSTMNLNLNFNRGIAFNQIKPSIVESGAATGGMISVHAFMDSNNNGVMDFDEEPAKNVAVKISGNSQKELTDEHGNLLLTGLPINSQFLFDADTSLMDDITVKPSEFVKRRIILQAGAPHKIAVAIVKVIDMEGTLTIEMGEEKVQVSNAEIQLIDTHNRIVATTTTTADGYYVFSGIPQGVYKVKAAKNVVEKYKKYLTEK